MIGKCNWNAIQFPFYIFAPSHSGHSHAVNSHSFPTQWTDILEIYWQFTGKTKPERTNCNSREKLSYRRDSAGRRSLRRSKSFKVTDFSTNRKPTCAFLLVINTNLHPISHRFQVIADNWSNVRFRQGIPVFNTLVRGEPLNLRPRDLAEKN